MRDYCAFNASWAGGKLEIFVPWLKSRDGMVVHLMLKLRNNMIPNGKFVVIATFSHSVN